MLWGPRRRIEVYFRGIYIGILRGPGHGNIGILGGPEYPGISGYLCFFVSKTRFQLENEFWVPKTRFFEKTG